MEFWKRVFGGSKDAREPGGTETTIERTIESLANRYVVRLRELQLLAEDTQRRLFDSRINDPYELLEDETPPPELESLIQGLTQVEKDTEQLPDHVEKKLREWIKVAQDAGSAADEKLIKIGEEVEAQYHSIVNEIKKMRNSRRLLVGFALCAGVDPRLTAGAYSRDESELSYQDDEILLEALRAELPGMGGANADLGRAAELKNGVPEYF